jgi:hypothetical protein
MLKISPPPPPPPQYFATSPPQVSATQFDMCFIPLHAGINESTKQQQQQQSEMVIGWQEFPRKRRNPQ